MIPFSFVHASDLHLDSPFTGIFRLEGHAGVSILSKLRNAPFDAFSRVIDITLEKHADFLLLSGDIYDHEQRNLAAQIFFKKELMRLTEQGIPSFVIHGNHDYLKGSRVNISMPDMVHVYRSDEVEAVPVYNKNADEIAKIHGISFREKNFSQNPVALFECGASGSFTIGLLHANAGGDKNHDTYAPCSIGDLLSAGFDYWALGHIHRHAILSGSHPGIVYPGTTQGRNIKETGQKGCCYVEVDSMGDLKIDFCHTSTVVWHQEEIDLDRMDDIDKITGVLDECVEELWGKLALDQSGIVRWILRGTQVAPEIKEAVSDFLKNRIFTPGAALAGDSEDVGGGRFLWSYAVNDGTSIQNSLKGGENIMGDLMKISDDILAACDKWESDGEKDDLLRETLADIDVLWKNRHLKTLLKQPDPDLLRSMIDEAKRLAVEAFLSR